MTTQLTNRYLVASDAADKMDFSEWQDWQLTHTMNLICPTDKPEWTDNNRAMWMGMDRELTRRNGINRRGC